MSIRKKDKIMHTLVVIGGFCPSSFPIDRSYYDTIIAADSGYDNAIGLSLVPDIVVGDFDSTSYPDRLVGMGFERSPRDKDESDTELALRLVDGGYDLLGGGEGRLDHTLSILSLFDKYSYPRYWFTRADTMISIEGTRVFSPQVSTELSLFSISGSTVTTQGLFWDIDNKRLDRSFLSLSNRTKDKTISIKSEGMLFLRIDPKDFRFFSD